MGARSTRGGVVRGSPRGGSGGGTPGRRRTFQKICKKSMKNLQFCKKFVGNFAIFSKFDQIFVENLDNNLENLEICVCRGFGGGAPPAGAPAEYAYLGATNLVVSSVLCTYLFHNLCLNSRRSA